MYRSNKTVIILLLIVIVISSVILERNRLYYPDNEHGLVCEYMILPEYDWGKELEKNYGDVHIYFKGEIYEDRIMKCYVVAYKKISTVWVAKQDVGSIEYSPEYVEVLDSNIVELSETEYRKVVDYAKYLSEVANDVPFDELGGYGLGHDDVCIKYKGEWYDYEFLEYCYNGEYANRLKSYLGSKFLNKFTIKKLYNDFWYDVADVFYEKSGFVYIETVDSRPEKWR